MYLNTTQVTLCNSHSLAPTMRVPHPQELWKELFLPTAVGFMVNLFWSTGVLVTSRLDRLFLVIDYSQLAPLNVVISVLKGFSVSQSTSTTTPILLLDPTTTTTGTSTTHYCPLMISPDRIRCRHSVSPTPTINTPCLSSSRRHKNRKAHLYIFTTV